MKFKKTAALLLCIAILISILCACDEKKIIRFDSQGGSPVSAIQLEDNEPLTLPTAPTKSGLYFGGWYTKAEGQGSKVNDGAIFSNNATLYAFWATSLENANKKPNIKITLDAKNGICDISEITIESGKCIEELPTPSRDKFIFGGWFYRNNSFDDEIVTEQTVFTTDSTIFAKWLLVRKLSFNAPDAINQVDLGPIQVLDWHYPVGLPVPVREGYRFIGWYTDYFPEETLVDENFLIVRDYTLYAKWAMQ